MKEALDTAAEYKEKLANNRLGFWLFLISDGFVFAALFITRFYLLGDTRPELYQPLGLIVITGFLAFRIIFITQSVSTCIKNPVAL